MGKTIVIGGIIGKIGKGSRTAEIRQIVIQTGVTLEGEATGEITLVIIAIVVTGVTARIGEATTTDNVLTLCWIE